MKHPIRSSREMDLIIVIKKLHQKWFYHLSTQVSFPLHWLIIYIFSSICKAICNQEEMNSMLQVQENARRELECIICLEVPKKESHVFSCLEHHLICLECSKHRLESCPVCKQGFRETPLGRNRLAEKMISQLFWFSLLYCIINMSFFHYDIIHGKLWFNPI